MPIRTATVCRMRGGVDVVVPRVPGRQVVIGAVGEQLAAIDADAPVNDSLWSIPERGWTAL